MLFYGTVERKYAVAVSAVAVSRGWVGRGVQSNSTGNSGAGQCYPMLLFLSFHNYFIIKIAILKF